MDPYFPSSIAILPPFPPIFTPQPIDMRFIVLQYKLYIQKIMDIKVSGVLN